MVWMYFLVHFKRQQHSFTTLDRSVTTKSFEMKWVSEGCQASATTTEGVEIQRGPLGNMQKGRRFDI